MRRVLCSLLAGVAAGTLAFVGLLPAAPSASSSTLATFSSQESRVFYGADGTATPVDQRHVTLTVSATTNLRNRQQLDVTWSGAHPTGGIVADLNAGTASAEEYPMVLLQCRGRGAEVTPETCWTSTAEERYQRSDPLPFEWPVWRVDAAASAGDRVRLAGVPDPLPSACRAVRTGSERWMPFRAADGEVYPGGALGCGGIAPEASAQGDVGLPSNTTYGVTGTNGKGSSRFTVLTTDDNASLGCSSSVPCSLVAVPIIGISCDAWGTRLPPGADRPTSAVATAADGYCRAPDTFAAGERQTGSRVSNLATSGALWWSASNWDSRIVVPLSFALSPNICGVVNKSTPLEVYGSVLFNEVAAQWMPKFCTTKGLQPFVHVQTADSSARSLITTGTASVALGSEPAEGGYGRPVVQAPVGLSGFAVTFNIDGADGERLTALKLDARLVAKLLTQSYPANYTVSRSYPALEDNPLNITLDPEFQALNPGAPKVTVLESAATMLTLNTDSDLMDALTSWIAQDPEAQDFLVGVPDPWGMKVNPNYRHVALPVSSWPLLDDFQPSTDTTCYNYAPAPYLGLVANPVGQLSTLVQDVQYAISNVDIACSPDADASNPNTIKLRIQGRQKPGERFMLGLVPLSAAYRYGLDIASLQTTSDVPLDDRFDDASGRTFVQPTPAALEAAAAHLELDPDQGLWTMPYDVFRTAAAKDAYPGTMPVYATVPTSGLSAGTAARAAQLLAYAAGPGQVSGIGTGQLPQGLLPLTEANGLGALSAYTACAAKAVAAQRGDVPVVGATTCRISAPAASPTPAPTATPTTVVAPVVPTGPIAPAVVVPSGAVPTAGAPAAVGAPAVSPVVETTAASTQLGRLGLPVAGFLVVLLGVFGAGLRWGETLVGALATAGRSVGRSVAKRARR